VSVHFPARTPRFGTKNKRLPDTRQKESPYYWWWECLRRNTDYRATCSKGGRGKCAALYKDFGDVFVEFKTWWQVDRRGARLFAEPYIANMEVVDIDNASERVSDSILLVTLPLNLPKSQLLKRFREILKEHHRGKQGVRVRETSRAMYKLNGKEDVAFFETALEVWDLRHRRPELALWEIANLTRCVSPHNLIRNDDLAQDLTVKKNLLSATASRYIRKAEAMIRNVADGRFPDTRLK
jgi:hypothetical protein